MVIHLRAQSEASLLLITFQHFENIQQLCIHVLRILWREHGLALSKRLLSTQPCHSLLQRKRWRRRRRKQRRDENRYHHHRHHHEEEEEEETNAIRRRIHFAYHRLLKE